MRRTILRDKLIQVIIEDENIFIEKCHNVDNFDEHGPDWQLELDGVDEAKDLIRLLKQSVGEVKKNVQP